MRRALLSVFVLGVFTSPASAGELAPHCERSAHYSPSSLDLRLCCLSSPAPAWCINTGPANPRGAPAVAGMTVPNLAYGRPEHSCEIPYPETFVVLEFAPPTKASR